MSMMRINLIPGPRRYAATARKRIRQWSWGVVAYSMMGALATFFSQQLGEPKVPLYLRLLSAIICAVVTILALPRFGIAGGAVATSVSYLVTFALATAYFCRQTGLTAQRLFLLSRQDLTPYRSALSYALRFTR